MGAIPVPLAVMGSPKCWQVETLMYFGGGFVLRSARSWYGLDVTYSPSFYLTLSGLVWRSAERLPTSSMPYSPAPAGFPPTEWGWRVVLLTYLPPVLQRSFFLVWPVASMMMLASGSYSSTQKQEQHVWPLPMMGLTFSKLCLFPGDALGFPTLAALGIWE